MIGSTKRAVKVATVSVLVPLAMWAGGLNAGAKEGRSAEILHHYTLPPFSLESGIFSGGVDGSGGEWIADGGFARAGIGHAMAGWKLFRGGERSRAESSADGSNARTRFSIEGLYAGNCVFPCARR